MVENKIGWCDTTWNPVVGCSPVSAGCDNCYAARMASRFRQEGEQFWGLTGEFFDECDESGYSKGPFNGTIDFHPERLEQPFHWRKPRRVFVCSMGDLFHESVTNEQIAAIMGVIAACPQHTFLILTKRPDRAVKWFRWLENMSQSPYDHEYETYLEIGPIFKKPLPSLWIGTSVEDMKSCDRLKYLMYIPSAKKFISYEPAIGPISAPKRVWDPSNGLDPYNGIPKWNPDLMICGAETGPHKRTMDIDWARTVRDKCKLEDVPFWFKKDSDGNETLDGVEHHPEFWR